MRMLRVEYDRYGGPDVMHLAQAERPVPEKHGVLVRVFAACANPIDWKVRNGDLKLLTGSRFPRGMGRDFAGIVEAVGPGVVDFKLGDQVFGSMEIRNSGAFADYVSTPESTITGLPSGLSFKQAAAIATPAKTAWGALVIVGHIRRGCRLLVNGCAGAVGRCAVQIGLLFGADISGTCSAADMVQAKQAGAHHIFDYRTFQPADVKKSFDLVFDTFGNLSNRECSMMLSGSGIALHINGSLRKMLGVLFSRRNRIAGVKTTSDLLRLVGDQAAEGRITLPIAKTVALAGACSALEQLEMFNEPKGKLLIKPNGSRFPEAPASIRTGDLSDLSIRSKNCLKSIPYE